MKLFIRRNLTLLLLLTLRVSLLFTPSVLAIEPNTTPKQLPQTGPTEVVLTTFALMMIVVAVIYWYRSTQILEQQKLVMANNQADLDLVDNQELITDSEIENTK